MIRLGAYHSFDASHDNEGPLLLWILEHDLYSPVVPSPLRCFELDGYSDRLSVYQCESSLSGCECLEPVIQKMEGSKGLTHVIATSRLTHGNSRIDRKREGREKTKKERKKERRETHGVEDATPDNP